MSGPIGLLVLIFVLNGTTPLRKAEVHCDGFVNYGEVDDGWTDKPMLTDSRGVAIVTYVPDLDIDPLVCHARKTGFKNSSGTLIIDKQHTKLVIKMEKE